MVEVQKLVEVGKCGSYKDKFYHFLHLPSTRDVLVLVLVLNTSKSIQKVVYL